MIELCVPKLACPRLTILRRVEGVLKNVQRPTQNEASQQRTKRVVRRGRGSNRALSVWGFDPRAVNYRSGSL